MAWKIRIDDVGSPAWHELRRQRDIARSWISDVAPLRKKRKIGRVHKRAASTVGYWCRNRHRPDTSACRLVT